MTTNKQEYWVSLHGSEGARVGRVKLCDEALAIILDFKQKLEDNGSAISFAPTLHISEDYPYPEYEDYPRESFKYIGEL